jgi:hypothetical protein
MKNNVSGFGTLIVIIMALFAFFGAPFLLLFALLLIGFPVQFTLDTWLGALLILVLFQSAKISLNTTKDNHED